MFGWQRRVNERRVQFLLRTQERLATMEKFLAILAAEPEDILALRELCQHFHQLAGAGGIYELNELCEIAIAGEEMFIPLSRDRLPLTAVQRQKCQMFMQALKKTVAEHLAADKQDSPPGEALSGSQASAAIVDGDETVVFEKVASAIGKPPGAPLIPQSGPQLDILLVDDSQSGLRELHRTLQDMKMIVRPVRSASGARGVLAMRLPDVMIVRVPLTDGSGYDLVQSLRNLPGGDRPVVIVLSAGGSFHDKLMAMRAGADAFFEQTVDHGEILDKIGQLMVRNKPRQYKVLSVEDDPDQAAFIIAALESGGFIVRHIADAERFEEELLSFMPDLILLDVMLGDINGFELARFVRQQERYAGVPIVFLTTQNQLDAHIESARSGGDEHLVKPVAPALLIATVAGRLERVNMLKTRN